MHLPRFALFASLTLGACTYQSQPLPGTDIQSVVWSVNPTQLAANGADRANVSVQLRNSAGQPVQAKVRLRPSVAGALFVPETQGATRDPNNQITGDADATGTLQVSIGMAREAAGVTLEGEVYASEGNSWLRLLPSGPITFNRAGAYHGYVLTPDAGTVVAGTAAQVSLHALDSNGVPSPVYQGNALLTYSDPGVSTPASVAVTAEDRGQVKFSATLFKAGIARITATEAQNSNRTGSTTLTVAPADANSLRVVIAGNPVAGAPADVVITALDPYGNIAAGYGGTVTVTVDGSDVATATFDPAQDGGVRTFPGAVNVTGSSVTVGASDATGLTGTSPSTPVQAAPASRILLVLNPNGLANAPLAVTVMAVDPYGNVDTTFRGTVRFASDDPQAVLPGAYTFTEADAGRHVFAGGVTLRTLDTAPPTAHTVVVAADGLSSGTASVALSLAPGGAYMTLAFDPSLHRAGLLQDVNITVRGADGAPLSAYSGTVTLNANDASATVAQPTFNLPASTTRLDDAIGFTAAGAHAVIAVDASDPNINGAAFLTVSPGDANHLVWGAPTGATVGVPQSAHITVLDAYDNLVTDYGGTLAFSLDGNHVGESLDPNAVTFTAAHGGTATVQWRFTHASTSPPRRLTAAGVGLSQSANIAVLPGAVDGLEVAAAPHPVACGQTSVTVTARDFYGNTVPSFSEAVMLALGTPDPNAVVPGPYTFVPAVDGGTHVFDVAFGKPQAQRLLAQSPNGLTGAQDLLITAGPASALRVSSAVSGVRAGDALTVHVDAFDACGNVATGFTGAVTLASTDAAAPAPGSHVYTAADAGQHAFSATLKRAPAQTLTASNGQGLTGALQLAVTPADAATLAFGSLSTAMQVDVPSPFTVSALDPYGNLATGFAGTVTLASDDPNALLTPSPHTFDPSSDAGSHAFTATFWRAGLRTLTAAAAGLPAASQPGIAVGAGSAMHAKLVLPATFTAGVAQGATVTLQDAHGNVATGYSGAITLSTNADPNWVVTPAVPYTFNPNTDQGAKTFMITFRAAGTATVSATASAGAVAGDTGTTTVSAGTVTSLALTTAASAVACGDLGVTVRLLDAQGNVSTAASPNVTLGLLGGPPSPLTGTTSAAPVAGIATFPGVSVAAAGTYRLHASVGTLSQGANVTVAATVPAVTITGVDASRSCVDVAYGVAGACHQDVTVEYQVAGSTVWQRATVAPTSPRGLSDLTAVTSRALTFTWDATADAPRYTGDANVRVKVGGVAATRMGVALGNGERFTPATDVTFPGAVTATVAADLTGDGVTDLAAAVGGALYVARGTSRGQLGTASNANVFTAAGSVVSGLAAADLDHDGHVDLVACLDISGVRKVLLVKNFGGTLGFTAAASLAVDCHGLQLADVDRDGAVDVVTVTQSPNTTVTWLSTAGWALSVGGASALSFSGSTLLAADFNRDGPTDFVVGSDSAANLAVAYGTGSGLVATAVTLPAGAGYNPASLVTGDFDGDGDLDLVGVPTGGGTAYFYRGIPTLMGSPFNFGVTLLTVGQAPVAAGDADGDGKLDLLSLSNGDIIVQRGLGDGTFVKNSTFPTTSSAASVTPVALNAVSAHDGAPLSLWLAAGNTVAVLASGHLDRCNPGLAAVRVEAQAASAPRLPAFGDLDEDGKVDMVVVNATPPALHILRGDGAGGFSPLATSTSGLAASLGHPAVLDVDADGHLDVVVPEQLGATAAGLAVFVGTGTGTVAVARHDVLALDAALPVQAVARDVNRDGATDLLVTCRSDSGGAGSVVVLLAPFTGAPQKFATGDANTTLLTVTDPNVDLDHGKGPDLVVTHASGDGIATLLNDGAGGFVLEEKLSGGNATGVATGDFDQDGVADVAFTLAADPSHFYIARGNSGANGRLDSKVPWGVAACDPLGLTAADFNGDGAVDLAVACATGARTLVLYNPNDGSGDLVSGTALHLPQDANAGAPVAVDVNSDGHLDLLALSGGAAPSASVSLNAATVATPSAFRGADAVSAGTPATAQAIAGAALADVNGDGRLDALAVGGGSTGFAARVTGDGNGVWGDPAAAMTTSLSSPRGLAVGDVNCDGAPDLAVFSQGGGGSIQVFFAQAGGYASSPNITLPNVLGTALALHDFNHDGCADLVALLTGPERLAFYDFDVAASGVTRTAAPISLSGTAAAFALADMNDDGGTDVLVAVANPNALTAHLWTGAGFGLGLPTSLADAPVALALGDLDHDGAVEAVYAVAGRQPVRVARALGGGLFTAGAAYSLPVALGATGQLLLADVTQDGSLDAVLLIADTPLVAVLAGANAASFGSATLYATGANAATVARGDVNRDGATDLVVGGVGSALSHALLTLFGR
jgi:hypothetical protein